MTVRARAVPFVVAALLALWPSPASAQLSDPCGAECGLVLGASSFVFASGTAAAVGRIRGGFHTSRQGIVTWTSGFLLASGSGLALSGNGDRQRRAVYLAGLGAVAGGLVGLTAEALAGDSSEATRLAATLIGAAAGTLAGGVYGALTSDGDAGPGDPLPSVVFSLPVGF